MDSLDSFLTEPEALAPLRAGMTQIVVAHAYGVPLDDYIRAPSRGAKQAALARQGGDVLLRIPSSSP